MPKKNEYLRYVCADNDVEILFDRENHQFEIGIIETGDWTVVGKDDLFRALYDFELYSSQVPVKTIAKPVAEPDKDGIACRAPVKVQSGPPATFSAMYFSDTNLPLLVSWLFYDVGKEFRVHNAPLCIRFPRNGGLTLFPDNWLVLDHKDGILNVFDDEEMRGSFLELG